MRALFLPLITGGAALGTISRCLAIAHVLRNQGHHVSFLTGGPACDHVSRSRFDLQEGPVPEPPGVLHPLHNLSDVARYLHLTTEDYVRRSLEAELRAIRGFKPDVIFSEFKLTACISARSSDIPLVSTACSPAHPRFISPLFPDREGGHEGQGIEGFNRVLDEHGLPQVKDVAALFFMRSDRKVVPSAPELEPLLVDVEGLHYVGYLIYDQWERAPLPPDLLKEVSAPHLVFAYFGTGEIGPDRYVRVLSDAFDHSGFHAVVAVGWHPDLPDLPESSPNVTYVRFVPGSRILEKSDVVIFHGGQNTAMTALLHGVPSLMVPGSDFERDFNARGIERIGAGIRMETDAFAPERVLAATRQLMGGDYRRNARAHGLRIRRLGGPARAAELILGATRGCP